MHRVICLRKVFISLLSIGAVCTASIYDEVKGQSATVQGMITDQETGRPLEGANISLQRVGEEELRGMAADRNGFYQVPGLPPDVYVFRVSYVGYVAYKDTFSLQPGETRTESMGLSPDAEQFEEVIVGAAQNGATDLSAGRQRITAADVRRIPVPAAGGDLVSYLQTLPGVVSTGDRGGELYIRGGTPSENMVLVDGTLIFQPFHILGFFSAFPEELVLEADFYAGGFGPRYTGRLSSVLDVKMRDGNRNEIKGTASISPFLGEIVMEGPFKRGKTSWIASVRRSFVEETGPLFLKGNQPLRYESQYFKVSHFGANDSRCSAMAMRTYDRGRLDLDSDGMVRWSNFVTGGRCILLPAGMLFDINVGLAHVSNVAGNRNNPELYSEALRVNLDANLTRYSGRTRFDYGWFVHIHSLDYDMSELFGGPQLNSEHLLSAGVYTETTIPLGETLKILPGLALTHYRETSEFVFEPRFRASWKPFNSSDEELNAAFGIYRQRLTGISDNRDVASVFKGWTSFPNGNVQMRAVHALLGWRQSIGEGFGLSVEGYYKWLRDQIIQEWNHLVQFTTELSSADGHVHGVDIRLEYNTGRRNLYAFVGYGYTYTEYETIQNHFTSWFGEPSRRYHPPHDRRHQINATLSLDLGKYTTGVRWELGSGLPFTQPNGFDELLHFSEKLPRVKKEYGTPRVIFEDSYRGRLPYYHRLDVSLERAFDLSFASLDIRAGIINLYDRANIFYYDVYTHRRVDQLPFAPYASLKLEVE